MIQGSTWTCPRASWTRRPTTGSDTPGSAPSAWAFPSSRCWRHRGGTRRGCARTREHAIRASSDLVLEAVARSASWKVSAEEIGAESRSSRAGLRAGCQVGREGCRAHRSGRNPGRGYHQEQGARPPGRTCRCEDGGGGTMTDTPKSYLVPVVVEQTSRGERRSTSTRAC